MDVWDGKKWGWSSARALSEGRYAMGTVALELKMAEPGLYRTVGFFAGGVGRSGNSFLVDLYDFANAW